MGSHRSIEIIMQPDEEANEEAIIIVCKDVLCLIIVNSAQRIS
jgi:hypothetical protein